MLRRPALCLAAALSLGVAGCSRSPSPAAKPAPPVASLDVTAQIMKGEQVYANNCALCHDDGKATSVMPALAGSPVVGHPPIALINVILRGQRGISVSDGRKLNGIMPGLPQLQDEEIAAVAAFVRKKFGGVEEGVSAAEVAKAR